MCGGGGGGYCPAPELRVVCPVIVYQLNASRVDYGECPLILPKNLWASVLAARDLVKGYVPKNTVWDFCPRCNFGEVSLD